MPIVPVGVTNLSAVNVPNVLVQIVPPNPVIIGVPTNIGGVVGTATWGPVNSPVTIGTMQQEVINFGNPQPVQYDLGTLVYAAIQQGANNFVCVRVTDGTDTAATTTLLDNQMTPVIGATLTAIYTGTVGNTLNAVVSQGSSYTESAPTIKLTIYLSGGVPEVFDNIGGTGATLWDNLVSAVNLGQSTSRPPSQLVIATVGLSTHAASLTLYTFSGGTNGNSGVTTETLIGSDSDTPRTGMYALRGTLASVAALADATDTTYWTDQVAYGNSEGTYMIGAMAAGYQDNISGAQTLLQTAGIDNYNFKLPLGDWIQINDPFNNQSRFISPQGFALGEILVVSPAGSSLNKPMNGIVATQKTAEGRVYSQAELQQIDNARLEVITKPLPVGNVFGCRMGINTSSNPLTNTDNYPRMINFLAASLNSQLGQFIGLPLTPDVVADAYAAITTFLGGLADTSQPGGALIDSNYAVTMDTNQGIGVLVANVQVPLFPILQLFVTNLQGNEGVTTQVLPPQLLQAS